MHTVLEQVFPENMTTADLDKLLQDRKYGHVMNRIRELFKQYEHDKAYVKFVNSMPSAVVGQTFGDKKD